MSAREDGPHGVDDGHTTERVDGVCGRAGCRARRAAIGGAAGEARRGHAVEEARGLGPRSARVQ